MNEVVTYKVGENTITLNNDVVRTLANGNTFITEQEIGLFITLCKDLKLNPFTREAYIIKYDREKPAQLVVSLNAFSRIADENPNFAGIEDGIIVKSGNNIVDRIGCVLYPNEVLIGGWAKVYRSDRQIPSVSRISLLEYSTGKSNWKNMPSTMINKCAKVSALRKAFPRSFSNCYVEEELIKENSTKENTVYEFESSENSDSNKSSESGEFTSSDDIVINDIVVNDVVETEFVSNTPDKTEEMTPENDYIYIPYSEYTTNKSMYEVVKLEGETTAYNTQTKQIRVRKI